MTSKPPSGIDKEQARRDPAGVFETPEQVRDHDELNVEEKVEILKRWAYDDADLDVAGEEGMPGGTDGDLQRRILLALEALGGDAALDTTGPSKQHGLFGARRRRDGGE